MNSSLGLPSLRRYPKRFLLESIVRHSGRITMLVRPRSVRPQLGRLLSQLCRRPASSSSGQPLSDEASLKPHSSPAHKAYSHTLLLPNPTFPLTPPSAKEQRKRFGRRTSDQLYAWQRSRPDALPSEQDFVFLDGPPYANGDLHMGHAMNKVLKDVINRYQVLQGRRVDYRPGWDCHGLPIENKALASLSLSASSTDSKKDFTSVPPAEIRTAASKVARKAVEGQKKTFEALGIMADWSIGGTYRTLDPSYSLAQLEIFKSMVAHSLVYTANRPTYYSPSSRTALAEAELKYKEDHESLSAWVKLDVPTNELGELAEVMKDARLEGESIAVSVWTTTPWTLGSNMAVMVNPELEYTLVRTSTGLLVIHPDRVSDLSALLSTDLTPLCPPFQGSRLLKTRYSPLFPQTTDQTNPVIPAQHVSSQSGTGLVHCAPAHGLDDYHVYSALFPSRGESDLLCPIDDGGCFTAGVEARLDGQEAMVRGNEVMLELVKGKGALLAKEKVVHKYPYDWKTDQPVMVRATSQWFANLDTIKEKALQALEDVNFVPASSRARLESFVRSRSEWCISRQRTWGVPIPALYSVSTGTPHLTPSSVDHILSVLSTNGGLKAWWDLPAEAFVSPDLADSAEGKDGWRKGTDTMDVWFDSGSAWSLVTPRESGSTVEKPLADVVLEGSDQHRGWFQSLLLTYLSASSQDSTTKPRAPYKTVVTHGMVLDDEKRKMSKSEGNILAPEGVMDGSAFKDGGPEEKGVGKKKKGVQKTHYGPDTLRVWAASNDYTSDSYIGRQAIDEASNNLFIVRRILRFLTGSVGQSTKAITEFEREVLTLADRYVLHLLAEYEESVSQQYESFAFHTIMKETLTLLNHLSAFYIDMTRDSLYSDSPDLPSRQIVLSVFQAVLNNVSQAVAPVAPFMIEELAEHRKDLNLPAQSAFSLRWQKPLPAWKDTQAKSDMQTLLEVKTHVSNLLARARDDKKANLGRMSHLEIQLDTSEIAGVIEDNRSILTNLFGVSHVTVVATPIDEPQPWEFATSFPTSSSDSATKINLRIYPSSMHKCPRCWDFTSPKEERLCVRCEGVVRDFEAALTVG